jgi:hypothetical protein
MPGGRGLSAVAKDPDGDGDGAIADEDDERENLAKSLEQGPGAVGGEAQGLEDAGYPVAQVAAQQHHGDDVEEGGGPPGEAIDNHFVHIVHLHPMQIIAVKSGVIELIAGANGEVQQVIDDESQDGQAAPDHDAGGGAGHAELLLTVGVFTRGFVRDGELDGRDDVDDHGEEEADTGDPDATAMQGGVEHVAVFIDGLRTCKDEQVAHHVTEDKADKGKAREGDEDFFTYRGAIKSGEGV